jgi:NADPH-dependent 2,4-dienoyl-CoA reductase/sulfur reductase-like enzyme
VNTEPGGSRTSPSAGGQQLGEFLPEMGEGARMAQYDLVVIGAGMGGVGAANRAAAMGARVALIEAGKIGGT